MFRRNVAVSFAAIVVLALSACTAPGASESITGQSVSVLGLWSGPEFDSFRAVADAWEQNTGATVEWSAASDLERELSSSADPEELPDIAVLPNVRLMNDLAAQGRLLPLTTAVTAEQLEKDYGPASRALGTANGELVGLFFKVNSKATFWYSPSTFADVGYEVPETLDGMVALADTMVADGKAPFSVVAPAVPGGGGWALTDWVSQLVLAGCGATHYDDWVAGRVPWSDPCVKHAFEQLLQVTQTPGYVLGGSQAILSTGDAEGAYPLFSEPPSAYLYYMASFAQAFIAQKFPDQVAGEDYATFPFPAVSADQPSGVTIGADIVVMLHDTPAARSFIAYLAGADSQKIWVEQGGFTSVNSSLPLDAYGDDVARATAEQLTSADEVRFSAGDSMPPSVQKAWWAAMRDLVKDPSKLDRELEALTAAAALP